VFDHPFLHGNGGDLGKRGDALSALTLARTAGDLGDGGAAGFFHDFIYHRHHRVRGSSGGDFSFPHDFDDTAVSLRCLDDLHGGAGSPVGKYGDSSAGWFLAGVGDQYRRRAGAERCHPDEFRWRDGSLVKRMTLDRCLPQFLLKETRRGTSYRIIIAFFILSVSVLIITQEDLKSLAAVYTLSFLSVMALFAIGNLLLKIKRADLPRPSRASYQTVLLALFAVLVAIWGNA